MFKNVIGKMSLFAFDTTTGVAKTGDAANITAYVNKDWAGPVALADTSASEISATNSPGDYLFDVAQAETNADTLRFTGKSTTANVSVVGLLIFTKNRAHFFVINEGVATAVAAGSVTLATGITYEANTLRGHGVYIANATTGKGQMRGVLSNTSATPSVLTLDENWDITPTGTVEYVLGALPLGSTTNPPVVDLVADAVDATSLAASAVTELQAGLATAAALAIVDDFLDTEVPALTTELAKVPKSDSTVSFNATAIAAIQSGLATAAALAIVDDFLDTEMASLISELSKVPKSDSTVSLNATVLAAIADAILNRDMATGADSGSPTTRTVRQALRALRNKWSISGTTVTYTKEDDLTESWTSVLTATPGADPVTASNPAG